MCCGGSGGGGSMSKNGDAGQPGEVVREANKANFVELDRMAATVTNNIVSGKMTIDQANAAHGALLSQAKKATGNEKNVLTLKAEVMKAGIDDAQFAMRKAAHKKKYGY